MLASDQRVMKKEERRSSRRIHFVQPIQAVLSNLPVSLIDLSTSGARLSHESSVPFVNGKRYQLEFVCDGEKFSLACQVVRSRMEQTLQQSSRRLTYTFGVRFLELREEDIERLWGLMALLAIDVLEHDNFENFAFDYELRTQ